MTDQEIAEIFLDHAVVIANGRLVLTRENYHAFARTLLSHAIPEGHVVVPGWQPIEQCKRENGKRYLLQKDCGDGTLPSITIGFSLDSTDKWFYNDGPIKSIEEYGYRVTHFQEMPGYAAAPANKEG